MKCGQLNGHVVDKLNVEKAHQAKQHSLYQYWKPLLAFVSPYGPHILEHTLCQEENLARNAGEIVLGETVQ